jgi:hypothetical protein
MLITLFDKSFIHGITVEEAAVFDSHFMSNITPLFFVEVLGDLEKLDLAEGEKRLELVKSLAAKTPELHSYPNLPHTALAMAELNGYRIEMAGRPHIGGGRRILNDKGLGTVFEETPEMRAKSRWHDGQFEDVEYEMAKAWRATLAANPVAMEKLIKGNAGRFSFRDYKAIKTKADELIDKGSRLASIQAAFEIVGIPPAMRPAIFARWKESGGPPLREFAPYTAFILSVDLFRALAMGSGHMSWEKTSNYVDLAYLYYLPFCQVFISTDKLHRQCAPLFMNPATQAFVFGSDLRPVLTALVTEYLAAPDLEEVGLMGVAGRKTFSPGTFLGDLYKKFHSDRTMGDRDVSDRLTPEAEAKLVAELKRQAQGDAPPPGTDLSQEDKTMTFKRMIRHRKGRFPVLPKRVIESSQKGKD